MTGGGVFGGRTSVCERSATTALCKLIQTPRWTEKTSPRAEHFLGRRPHRGHHKSSASKWIPNTLPHPVLQVDDSVDGVAFFYTLKSSSFGVRTLTICSTLRYIRNSPPRPDRRLDQEHRRTSSFSMVALS